MKTVEPTSHTVIVVDQSSSMNYADIFGHRSRSRGAYYTIANIMVAEPLMNNLYSYTDLVTVIEMRTDAHVNPQINMEPITWDLYNKLVDLVNNPLSGKGHGNYIPALRLAAKTLAKTDQYNCAKSILFLSDGRPSDHSCSNMAEW